MLKTKQELCNHLYQKCKEIVFDNVAINNVAEEMNQKYNVPTGLATDMIVGREKLEDFTEYMLFVLLDGFDIINSKNEKSVFFTNIEVNGYSRTQFEDVNISFPIRIKCINVDADQWVGATDVQFLMQLRKAQLINYNVNAQRTMRRIVRGEKVSYKIMLNKVAINSIKKSFQNSFYIPNTITLNIPEETEYDFYYDSKNCELVIENLTHFDISDGYHRYIAMCQIADSNPDFNYKMELRIINFSIDKVKQFIYQEDQKTKMKRVDSKSMNINSPANIVTDRLNSDPRFNLRGKINRNEGLINYSEFAALVEYLYFKDTKESGTKEIIQIKDDIRDKFNFFTETNIEYLDHRFDYLELAIMLYRFKETDEMSTSEVNKIIDMIRRKEEIDKRTINGKIPKKKFINEIKKLEK